MGRKRGQGVQQPKQVHRVDRAGLWVSDYQRYFDYAHAALEELLEACELVKQHLAPHGDRLKGDVPPEIWKAGRRRDRLSDSARIFSAMSVEAFLNLVGTIRLEEAYAPVEFFGLVSKLQTISRLCDAKEIAGDDPIAETVRQIASERASLVHPKALTPRDELDLIEIAHIPTPEAAQAAVARMEMFYTQIVQLWPGAKHLVDRLRTSDE